MRWAMSLHRAKRRIVVQIEEGKSLLSESGGGHIKRYVACDLIPSHEDLRMLWKRIRQVH